MGAKRQQKQNRQYRSVYVRTVCVMSYFAGGICTIRGQRFGSVIAPFLAWWCLPGFLFFIYIAHRDQHSSPSSPSSEFFFTRAGHFLVVVVVAVLFFMHSRQYIYKRIGCGIRTLNLNRQDSTWNMFWSREGGGGGLIRSAYLRRCSYDTGTNKVVAREVLHLQYRYAWMPYRHNKRSAV